MDNETMETRVTILERDVAELRQLVPIIHGMDKKLDVLAARKECPNPGGCLTLEPRVRALEDERNKALGGWKVLLFIGSIVGGVAGWIVSKITHSP